MALLDATKHHHWASIVADGCNWSSLPLFFQVFSSSTCKINVVGCFKAPVFNRGITYQTKEMGLIKVSV